MGGLVRSMNKFNQASVAESIHNRVYGDGRCHRSEAKCVAWIQRKKIRVSGTYMPSAGVLSVGVTGTVIAEDGEKCQVQLPPYRFKITEITPQTLS